MPPIPRPGASSRSTCSSLPALFILLAVCVALVAVAAVARVALRKLASAPIAANVSRQAAALRQGLAALNDEFKLFSQVRGRGLMLGAVLNQAHAGQAGAMLDHAAAHGLLTLQAGPDVLRFVPPLNITDQELAEGMKRLHGALRAYVATR